MSILTAEQVTVPRVTADEVKKKLESHDPVVLVGVLKPEKWEQYRLPGAISADELRAKLHEVSHDTQIIAYCG